MARRTPLSYSAAADFRAALRRYARRTEEICREHGLSPEQYTLLLMIKGSNGSRAESSTVTELAGRLHLAHNGVAERVRRAEEVGLVRRVSDPTDRRVSWITLTRKGDKRLEAAFHALGEESGLLISVVSQVDQ